MRRAGAIPVLIAPGEAEIDDLLARLDGVILAGGGDLDPQRWGGEPHPTIEFVDADRDDLELALAERVLDEGIPTLAICRGLQVVNTVLGGTLHPHLADAVESDVPHRAEPKWSHTHVIDAEAGSLVAEVMGAEQVEPACWHHQAIARPGAGLAITAWSPDGVIEAVERPATPGSSPCSGTPRRPRPRPDPAAALRRARPAARGDGRKMRRCDSRARSRSSPARAAGIGGEIGAALRGRGRGASSCADVDRPRDDRSRRVDGAGGRRS